MYSDITPVAPSRSPVTGAIVGRVVPLVDGGRYEIVIVKMHSPNPVKRTVVVTVTRQSGINLSHLPNFDWETATSMDRATSLIRFHKEGINDIIDYLRLFEPARRWLRRAWGLSLQDMKKFLNNKEKKS